MSETINKNNTQFKHSMILLLTALIWGTSFVAQSTGLKLIGPFSFTALRMPLGAAVLIPFICAEYHRNKQAFIKHDSKNASYNLKKLYKDSIYAGIPIGILLSIASNLQQLGMLHASAGKAGFITAFYIVLVPIFGIFLHKKTGLITWISVFTALIGLYYLCIGHSKISNIDIFDIFLLCCAIFFSLHILTVDKIGSRTSGLVMSATQFIIAGLISIPFIFLIDKHLLNMPLTITNISKAAIPIGYSGLLSCGAAYTLQIIGQQGVNPTLASLIMSLESVTSAIAGFFILNQKLTKDQLTGCIIMFAAVILAQLPSKVSFHIS